MYNTIETETADRTSFGPGRAGQNTLPESAAQWSTTLHPFEDRVLADAAGRTGASAVGMHRALKLSRPSAPAHTTIFGPCCRPMFYTAMLQQPVWLAWSIIPGAVSCTVRIEDGVSGELIWSASGGNHSGFRWALPELGLKAGDTCRWSVAPIFANTSVVLNTDASPEGTNDRLAQFWLLQQEDREKLRTGLAMLRERSDPAFLAIAEALYLAEFQLYHHALKRLPIMKDGGSTAYSALHASARSVIFRQMAQAMRQSGNVPDRFLDWAERNECYHRDEAEHILPVAEIRASSMRRRGAARRQRIGRSDPAANSMQTAFT